MKHPPIGYSGTPLARKLGIKAGTLLTVRRAPDNYLEMLKPLPKGVAFYNRVSQQTDIVHVFCEKLASLRTDLESLRTAIRPDAIVWISWPKKASGVSTDITDNIIRELALPLGFVDVKVCAVSEVWSGLKLVIRKELRRG